MASMEEQIIIEGNCVKRVRTQISEVTTTKDFLRELSLLSPVVVSPIPRGVIAVAMSEGSLVYHVGMPARITTVTHAMDLKSQYRIFIPTSIFSVAMHPKQYNVLQSYWHFVKGPYEDIPLDSIQALLNILPNVDYNNRVCEGMGKIKHDPKRKIDHTLNQAIATILDSPYNWDLFRGDDYKTEIVLTIKDWASREAINTWKNDYTRLTKDLMELERQNFAAMSKEQVEAAKEKRKEIIWQREEALSRIDQAQRSFDWKNFLFPYLDQWTKENEGIIAKDPIEASDQFYETFSAKLAIGSISGSGQIMWPDRREERL